MGHSPSKQNFSELASLTTIYFLGGSVIESNNLLEPLVIKFGIAYLKHKKN